MDVQDGLLHDAMVKAKTRLNVSWTISSSSSRLFSHQMELIPPSRNLERRYRWYCDADRLGEDPYVLAEVRLPRELVSSHRTSLEDRKLILSTFIYARSKLLVLALIQQTNPASQHRSLPLQQTPTSLRNPLHLHRALNLRHPIHPLPSEQLRPRFRIRKSIRIIHDADLDHDQPRERLAGAEERGAAIAAEGAGDGLAGVAGRADGLGPAGHEGEGGLRDGDVGAVGAAADLAAVAAVADGLRVRALAYLCVCVFVCACGGREILRRRDVCTHTFIVGSPVYSTLTFPQKHPPSFAFDIFLPSFPSFPKKF